MRDLCTSPGTNDYYAWPYPSDEQFVGGYVRMVETVLAAYNSTTASGAPLTVIALCGGTTENDRAPCPRVQQAVKRLLASPDKVQRMRAALLTTLFLTRSLSTHTHARTPHTHTRHTHTHTHNTVR